MKKRLYGLDYLRIAAAIIIYFFHYNINIGGIFMDCALDDLLATGNVVMTLFFMISGFALYYNYSDRDFASLKELGSFYKKRIIAIAPLYFASFLCWFFVMGIHMDLPQLLSVLPIGLTMSFNVVLGINGYGFGGYLWFLSAMVFCYLMFPLLATIIRQQNKKQRLSTAILFYIIIVSSGLSLHLITGDVTAAYASCVFRCLEFALGMIVCAFFKDGVSLKKFESLAFLGLAALTMILRGVFYTLIPVNNQYISDFYLLPMYALLILAGASLKENDLLYKAASTKAVQFFSKLTFAIYVSQQWVFHFYKAAVAAWEESHVWFTHEILMRHDRLVITLGCLALSIILTLYSDTVKKWFLNRWEAVS